MNPLKSNTEVLKSYSQPTDFSTSMFKAGSEIEKIGKTVINNNGDVYSTNAQNGKSNLSDQKNIKNINPHEQNSLDSDLLIERDGFDGFQMEGLDKFIIDEMAMDFTPFSEIDDFNLQTGEIDDGFIIDDVTTDFIPNKEKVDENLTYDFSKVTSKESGKKLKEEPLVYSENLDAIDGIDFEFTDENIADLGNLEFDENLILDDFSTDGVVDESFAKVQGEFDFDFDQNFLVSSTENSELLNESVSEKKLEFEIKVLEDRKISFNSGMQNFEFKIKDIDSKVEGVGFEMEVVSSIIENVDSEIEGVNSKVEISDSTVEVFYSEIKIIGSEKYQLENEGKEKLAHGKINVSISDLNKEQLKNSLKNHYIIDSYGKIKKLTSHEGELDIATWFKRDKAAKIIIVSRSSRFIKPGKFEFKGVDYKVRYATKEEETHVLETWNRYSEFVRNEAPTEKKEKKEVKYEKDESPELAPLSGPPKHKAKFNKNLDEAMKQELLLMQMREERNIEKDNQAAYEKKEEIEKDELSRLIKHKEITRQNINREILFRSDRVRDEMLEDLNSALKKPSGEFSSLHTFAKFPPPHIRNELYTSTKQRRA